MRSLNLGSLFASLFVLLPLASGSGCGGDRMGVAAIAGRFATQSETGAAKALKNNLDPRIIDSQETSLFGLSVELELWREQDNPSAGGWEDSLALDEVLGVEIPDAEGRFFFDNVPGALRERGHPYWGGYFFVRIVQEQDTPVSYGAGAQIKYVWEEETLPLSVPLVSRFMLPSWFESSPNPAMGPLLSAHAGRSLLVYLHPQEGIGIFDPVGSTVVVSKMVEALDFEWHADRLEVLEATDQAVIAMVHETPNMPSLSARFVLVDLSVLIEQPGSVVLDPEDPDVGDAVRASLRVIDVEPSGEPDLSEWRIMGGPSLEPKSFLTADGSRYYHGRWGSTFVLDLGEGTLVEAYHDNGLLGAYNPELDHLYFDLPGGILRVRKGDTGDIVADVDLGASHLLGAVALPGESRTLVSYESSASPLEHRIVLIDGAGEIISNALAGDFLGYTDRNWNEAYDWGTCSSYFYRTPDCPGCPTEPPADIFPVYPGMASLFRLNYTFDEARSQLIVGEYGFRFAYEDGIFHPMPSPSCGHFAVTSRTSECDGFPTYDSASGATVISTPDTICVMHLDGSDLIVPVRVERPAGDMFDKPAVLPGIGSAFTAGSQGITAVHYRNPGASQLPAVRDLRAVHSD